MVNVPLFKVYMSMDIDKYILPVLHSGYVGDGPKVKEFEKKFGEFIQNENVVMVNSGTSAIVMALRLAGVGHGDHVMTTPMTCLATNMAILSIGAIPVWADILEDGTLDPEDVRGKMSKSIKAIMCMDWGGIPCKLDELRQFGVPLIEDACQALGSIYKGKPIGSNADFVCFSFQAIKHLTTVDGGALVVNGNPKLFREAKLMRWFGLDRDNGASMRCTQDPPIWGYKMQSNDVSASIGLANLRYTRGIIWRAGEIAKRYDEAFTMGGKVRVPQSDPERVSGHWLYTILVDNVPEFIVHMQRIRVECSPVHDRNDKKSVFEAFRVDLQGVHYFDSHHVCIPVGWWLREKDVQDIIKSVLTYGGYHASQEKDQVQEEG